MVVGNSLCLGFKNIGIVTREIIKKVIDKYCPDECVLAQIAVDGRLVSPDEASKLSSREVVRDKLGEYVERLGISHLIVRAGFSGISDAEQLRSHGRLLEVVSDF